MFFDRKFSGNLHWLSKGERHLIRYGTVFQTVMLFWNFKVWTRNFWNPTLIPQSHIKVDTMPSGPTCVCFSITFARGIKFLATFVLWWGGRGIAEKRPSLLFFPARCIRSKKRNQGSTNHMIRVLNHRFVSILIFRSDSWRDSWFEYIQGVFECVIRSRLNFTLDSIRDS